MKQLLLRGLLALFVMVSITSCSKDEPTPDNEKLLTAHTWVKENIRVDTDDPYLEERIEGYLLVLEYTRLKFNKDHTYEGSFGNGTWELSTDKKKILLDQQTVYKEEWPIHELKANSLKVSWKSAFVDTENNVYEATIFMDLVPEQ